MVQPSDIPSDGLFASPTMPAAQPNLLTVDANRLTTVVERLRPVLLCCNRVFRERAISRMIAGYYKDLLEDEVIAQMDALSSASLATLSDDFCDSHTKSLVLTQLFYSMKCYAKSQKIFVRCLDECRIYSPFFHEKKQVDDFMAAIAEGLVCHSDYSTHTFLMKTFATFLLPCLENRTSLAWPWPAYSIGVFLDRGGADLVLRRDFTFDDDPKNMFVNVQHVPYRCELLKIFRTAIVDGKLVRHSSLLAPLSSALQQEEEEEFQRHFAFRL